MPVTRRELLLGAAAAPLAAKDRRAARPNIVLIVADDLAAWMLGCYGNREIRTPNIDLLARSGMRFLTNLVCTPSCSPSRATLFTGRTPMQHGIQDFLTAEPIENPPQGQAAPPPSFASEIMLSDILAGQGYRCGYAGVWRMGNDQQPQHHYDFWYTLAGGALYQDPRMSWNGEAVQEKGYAADLVTAKALQFLDAQKPGQPFLLVVSHLNPHAPYEGHPAKYYQMYAGTNFETTGWEPPAPNALRDKEYLRDIVGNIRKCAAAATALDDQIPPLLARLEQRGLRDDTLIIFTADSGFLLGRHGLWSNGLASDPINMYEEVMATPMIWNWRGKTPPEATRPELVSSYDLLPSLCEVSGAPLPQGRNLCGRSYLPAVLNRPFPKKDPWRSLVFGHFRNTGMARDTRYKVVLRNGGSGPNELYDLRADPREKVNQYDNAGFLSVRDRLARELEAWRAKYS